MNLTSPTDDRFARVTKTAGIHHTMEAKKTLANMSASSLASSIMMQYFIDLHENYLNGNLFTSTRKKVVATMCIHVPVEFIYAAGAIPVRLCSGSYSSDVIGAEFLPAKSCPMVKATMGALYANVLPGNRKPDLIINPATCDQKKKIGEIAAELDHHFHLLEIPSSKDTEEARAYWLESVMRLFNQLEKLTGQKITEKSLKHAIQKVARAQAQYRIFHQLRTTAPIIYGSEAMLVTNAFFFDDIESWTENLQNLNEELKDKLQKNILIEAKHSPRLLLTGSPSIFPNMKLPILAEELGGLIVSEEFCSSSRMLWDTVAVDEWHLYDMIPAIADRYLKASTCPNFSPNTDRKRKILSDIESYKIDGVIYQTFTGCQLFDMETRIIGKALEKAGVPVLFIETDYSPEDAGQLTTRIEAFLHALKNGKKRNR